MSRSGAGNEIRTRNPQLGRLMLQPLSYSRPLQQFPDSASCLLQLNQQKLVVGVGFEPTKSDDDRFTVCSLWPLGNPTTLYPFGVMPVAWQAFCFSHCEKMWSWRWDLNPQPPDYKSGALPIELHQHEVFYILFEKLLQAIFFSLHFLFLTSSECSLYINLPDL